MRSCRLHLTCQPRPLQVGLQCSEARDQPGSSMGTHAIHTLCSGACWQPWILSGKVQGCVQVQARRLWYISCNIKLHGLQFKAG